MADCSASSFDFGKASQRHKPAEQPYSCFDLLMKVLIVGNSSVGKTNILNRLVGQRFCNSYVSTIGLDFKVRTVQISDKLVKLQIWDTAGQERFKTLTRTYYQAASLVLIVFSVGDTESYEYTESWLKQINECCSAEVRKVLVANKSDMPQGDKHVSSEQVRSLAERFGVPCVEYSAKTNQGFDQLEGVIKDQAKLVLDTASESQLNYSSKFKRKPVGERRASQKVCCRQ